MAAVLEAVHEKAVIGDLVWITPINDVAISAATVRNPLFVAPFDMNLRQIAFISSTVFTGEDTTTLHHNLIDGGPEGAGTTEFATIDYDSGTDLAPGKTVIFDGTTTARALTQGDIIELEALEVSTGHSAVFPNCLAYIVGRAA